MVAPLKVLAKQSGLRNVRLHLLPNALSHGLTNPAEVYVLRWITGRHAGVAEFNPPYTIA